MFVPEIDIKYLFIYKITLGAYGVRKVNQVILVLEHTENVANFVLTDHFPKNIKI